MNYTYEFTELKPKQGLVQIKFSADGHDDVFKNVIVQDFGEENLHAVAKSYGPGVVALWNTLAAMPEEVVLNQTVFTTTLKEDVVAERPAFNEDTHKLVQTKTETDTQVIYGWDVVSLTAEEVAERTSLFRAQAAVTMRQARLALAQQGLLGSVTSAIASMPQAEKEAVEIEWEYSATVERKSPWVASMTTALGLTDEQMDDLFKLAVTL